MLGGGGSVLAVPVLVYVLGQGVHDATTTSLVVVTAGALAGGIAHARGRRVCWGHAAVLVAAALPGVVAGTALGDRVGDAPLLAAFAVVIVAAAVATWRRTAAPARMGSCPPLRVRRGLAAGVLVGALTGFFGIGGAVLIVLTLAIVLALSMRLAVGTSLAVVAATSMTALAAHLVADRTLDLGVTASMTAACVVGALAGGRAAHRVPERLLSRGFAAVVTVVAAYILLSVVFAGGTPGRS